MGVLSEPIGSASWFRGLDWEERLKYIFYHPGLNTQGPDEILVFMPLVTRIIANAEK